MNRPVPCGGRSHRSPGTGGPSRFAGAVPGSGRLVGGTAASASQPRFGHPSRTFGARALGRDGLAWGGQGRKREPFRREMRAEADRYRSA
jgi:hypothetical protein